MSCAPVGQPGHIHDVHRSVVACSPVFASLLYAHDDTRSSLTEVYISGRPFVLRDASEPRRTLKLSDRAENLEAIEQRLKTDILVEANK